MELLHTEGIVLKAFNLGDYDRVMTVFSKNDGLMKLVVKKGSHPKWAQPALTMPLTCVEYYYAPAKHEIFRFHEGHVLNNYLPLRQKLEYLEAASHLVQGLLSTQFLGKPAPLLYQLFAFYLNKIPTASNPQILVNSFRLKLMSHDGQLVLRRGCSVCKLALTTSYMHRGECFCEAHACEDAELFLMEEMEMLAELAYSRSLPHLNSLELSQTLEEKISRLFSQLN